MNDCTAKSQISVLETVQRHGYFKGATENARVENVAHIAGVTFILKSICVFYVTNVQIFFSVPLHVNCHHLSTMQFDGMLPCVRPCSLIIETEADCICAADKSRETHLSVCGSNHSVRNRSVAEAGWHVGLRRRCSSPTPRQ